MLPERDCFAPVRNDNLTAHCDGRWTVAMKAESAKAGTLVLVGCGQMGGAMLRGWLARGAAERFVVVEPAGPSRAWGDAQNVAFHRSADELPERLGAKAVVFAVKPQIIAEVVPSYRRWARPQTVFISIAAGTT